MHAVNELCDEIAVFSRRITDNNDRYLQKHVDEAYTLLGQLIAQRDTGRIIDEYGDWINS